MDGYLSSIGRLVLIEKPSDVKEKIKLIPRTKNKIIAPAGNSTIQTIVDRIDSLWK